MLVFNTCTIREKPDQRLAAHLGDAAALKRRRPGTVVAVGGCYAEAQRDRIFEQYPFVDVAFGPGTIRHLGDWLGAGGVGIGRSAFGIADERRFSAELPTQRERPVQAWVQVSMGCNSVCSYCIVPRVRGREVSRRPGEILAEVRLRREKAFARSRLLGQNVNSYGRDLAPEIDTGFAELLRALDAIDGIERIRFTSPHPEGLPSRRDRGDGGVRRQCANTPICRCSRARRRLLKRMRRTYSRERYLRLVEELRAAIPDLALTTDIIVGFPGETDDDFAATLEVDRGGRLRRRLHVRLFAPQRHRGRRNARSGARSGQARAASSSSSSSSSGSPRSETPCASVGSRRCSSKGRAGPTPLSGAGERDATRP